MGTYDTKTFEVRFALSLLKYLHANTNNVYLLLAIVSWTRDASGTKWIGNNPLKINNGKAYSSLSAAAYATAKKLIAGKGWYDTLLKVVKRTGTSQLAQQTQAQDFLTVLAYTGWDAKFFGVSDYVDPAGHWVLTDETSKRVWYDPAGHWVLNQDKIANNRLLDIWQKLLGHPVTIPGTPAPPPPKPPTPKPIVRPKIRELPTQLHADYIDPYAALGFYNARPGASGNVPRG